ncbi:MAG: endonuclease, partial [Hymenobacteraceae bacterium]|nr:endonuclease [Hymenobacteraceae bacterium]
VTLTNNLGYPVEVTNIRFFNTYGAPAFSADQSRFTIANGATHTVQVTFTPQHNIAHNTEMVLETNSKGGNISIDLTGQGKYSKTYYNSTENLSEEQLKTALKSTISAGYRSLGYNTARDKMYMEFDNRKVNGQGATVNTLECVYTGRVVTGYTSRSDIFNTHSINCEHTFPQGHFNSAEPMKSDIHHLFPTDESANGSRNNYPFGMATLPYRNDQINNPSHLGANNVYEPRDAQKGATARAMLYFVTRYQDYQNFFASQQPVLKTWNTTFAPTAAERKRNDDIQTVQFNRNPFVDYPQFADRITNFVSNSTAPVVNSFYKGDAINYGNINAGTSYVYNFVVVNTGNQPLQLSNKTLSNAVLSFANNTAANVTVAPGEAHTMQVNIQLPSTDSIAETLTFSTNLPGAQGTVTVPVYANKRVASPLGTGSLLTDQAIFELFPNPVQDELVVIRTDAASKGNYNVSVYNTVGQEVLKSTLTGEMEKLNVSGLERGVYILRLHDGKVQHAKRFVKVQ